MRLKTVFARFYKSFNYDYLRRYREGVKALPWEDADGLWYPFVRIPIDPLVTTVVGANESGKTHLLTAIEKGISGQGIERGDFCRYSRFFSAEEGKSRAPDFGFEWSQLTDRDRTRFAQAIGVDLPANLGGLHSFRNGARWDVYLPTGSQFAKHTITGKAAEGFTAALPSVFRIDPQVALPDSVSIRFLADDTASGSQIESFSRSDRLRVLEAVEPLATGWSPESLNAPQAMHTIAPALVKAWTDARSVDRQSLGSPAAAALAKDLIRKVARIDREALTDLYGALKGGKEGYAQGLIEKINQLLASRLNFPKWWVQDKDFALRVAPREFDLVFTIRDRTGTEYSFGERSHGLKYFLSYYVQYLAHTPRSDRDEILVMDEPDTFLSSQAQQDLVRVFEAFANPVEARPPVQVVYVTHSPFLIDKNHAERIRVLEKGVGDEGTRVVRDAAKNHYEPLRSAFGAFVAETTFMGACNLMVEGLADQVLLAGASTFMRTRGATGRDVLDLNRLTIVPAGSASHVPYLVFLARGRDVERPAVIVLLDSDEAGNTAAKHLRRGGPKNKQLIAPKFILQVGDVQGVIRVGGATDLEIEDLIPIDLCVAAVHRYFEEFGTMEAAKTRFTVEALAKKLGEGSNTWTALESIAAGMEPPSEIDKVAFSRAVVASIQTLPDSVQETFAENVSALFRELNARQRAALKERTEASLKERIDRARSGFLRDHQVAATREEALLLFADVEEVLDDSQEADAVRIKLQALRRDFQLTEEVTRPVDRFEDFRSAIEHLKYLPKLITQDENGSTESPS